MLLNLTRPCGGLRRTPGFGKVPGHTRGRAKVLSQVVRYAVAGSAVGDGFVGNERQGSVRQKGLFIDSITAGNEYLSFSEMAATGADPHTSPKNQCSATLIGEIVPYAGNWQGFAANRPVFFGIG